MLSSPAPIQRVALSLHVTSMLQEAIHEAWWRKEQFDLEDVWLIHTLKKGLQCTPRLTRLSQVHGWVILTLTKNYQIFNLISQGRRSHRFQCGWFKTSPPIQDSSLQLIWHDAVTVSGWIPEHEMDLKKMLESAIWKLVELEDRSLYRFPQYDFHLLFQGLFGWRGFNIFCFTHLKKR